MLLNKEMQSVIANRLIGNLVTLALSIQKYTLPVSSFIVAIVISHS